jgi:mRNA interferase MazF
MKLRPGVIVSKDLNNDRLNDIIIAICTSNISRYYEDTQLLIDGENITKTGIKVASVVKCESLFTINKSMILKALGTLPRDLILKLDECLKNALDL